MTNVHEIAPDLFRLSIYVSDFDMQFNQFRVRDEEPLLFSRGVEADVLGLSGSRRQADVGVGLFDGRRCGSAADDALRAETRMAAALTPEAVWDAINAAKDGDTVQLPAGTAVWTQGMEHRALGEDESDHHPGRRNRQDDHSRRIPPRAAGDKSFVVNGVEGKPFRITGITFDGTGFPNAGTWAGEIVISGNCKNFRVDHCKFLNMDQMMTITGDTYGLIDHC